MLFSFAYIIPPPSLSSSFSFLVYASLAVRFFILFMALIVEFYLLTSVH